MSMKSRDPRVRDYIAASRIVWQQGVRDAGSLLKPGPGQTTIWSRPGAFLPCGASVLLDFGKELHGGVQIISGGCRDNKILRMRVRFGESVSEAMGEPNNDHSMHDSVIDIAPMGWQEFGCTGFRFVRIDALSPDFEIEVKELRAVSLMRDLEYIGSFECSDVRLNEIWQTGAYTTHLCMQDYIWDGIKRDRLVWMGDMHPEAMVAAAVFGRSEVIERSMDLTRDETELPRHMNGIGSYSLWWIITQRDWYKFHGAAGYLEEQRDYLKKLLRLAMDTMVGSDGVECMPGRRFLDWPSNDDKAALHAGLQALLAIAFDAGAELCAALGEASLGAECAAKAALMRSKVPPPVASKQVNALQALAGMRGAVEINRDSLGKDPFRGISTFYGYYVLQARAAAGDYAGSLDLIRKYWGGMLDLGATSFWEHFELDWMEGAGRIDEMPKPGQRDVHKDCGAYCFKGLRHSFCHGWASGPTAWLSEHVLGVKILKPGAALVSVKPQLGGLEWARGRFPTPFGPIEVEHKALKGGGVESKVKAPSGVEIAKA